jgi:hypothetical protein
MSLRVVALVPDVVERRDPVVAAGDCLPVDDAGARAQASECLDDLWEVRRSTPPGRLTPATVGHSECGLLVGLQSELLGQHDIPKGKVAYRTEAPDGNLGLARTDLVDIHIPAAANTIALARVGAPHFEKSVFV